MELALKIRVGPGGLVININIVFNIIIDISNTIKSVF